jgi:uncharacterized protein (DUF2267 family)
MQVDVFQATFQKTGEWLRDIRDALDWGTDQRAYVALRAVLQTLRDRLPIIEAVHVGSQLPMLIRGFYYEGWTPLDTPIKFNREGFLMSISAQLGNHADVDVEQVVRTVVDVMAAHTSPNLVHKIAGVLPKDFADLTPAGIATL